MHYLGVTYDMKHVPELDPGFIPFGVWADAYRKGAEKPLAIAVERDFDELIRRVTEQDRPVFLIPTYTAMLDLRGRLAHLCGTREFWE